MEEVTTHPTNHPTRPVRNVFGYCVPTVHELLHEAHPQRFHPTPGIEIPPSLCLLSGVELHRPCFWLREKAILHVQEETLAALAIHLHHVGRVRTQEIAPISHRRDVHLDGL